MHKKINYVCPLYLGKLMNKMKLVLLLTKHLNHFLKWVCYLSLSLSFGSSIALANDYLNDPDLERNHSVISGGNLSYDEDIFKDKITWVFQRLRSPKSDFPIIFLPHDNEDEAFDSSVKYISENGGTIVSIECGESRKCEGIDPNRNFKSKGLYFRKVMQIFEQTEFVITLHNNSDNDEPGGYGIVYADVDKFPKIKERQKKLGISAFYNGGDPDNLVFLNGKSKEPSGKNKELLSYLTDNRISALYEYNLKRYHDGSLSYVATDNNKFYINIEAQHGDYLEQLSMLETLMQW